MQRFNNLAALVAAYVDHFNQTQAHVRHEPTTPDEVIEFHVDHLPAHYAADAYDIDAEIYVIPGYGYTVVNEEDEAMTNQSKITAIHEALNAYQRGVKEPSVVVDEAGAFSYIPGAHLTDGAYHGSRNVVMTIDPDMFQGLNIETATDDELQSAAVWAAAVA